jgi:hypothetical protein
MSLIDEMDKAFERMYGGGFNDNSQPPPPPLPEPSEQEKMAMKAFEDEINLEISQGITRTHLWVLNGEWIDIIDGQFNGRMFRPLTEIPAVTDTRIIKYLSANKIYLESNTIKSLAKKLVDKTPSEAKETLDAMILQCRNTGYFESEP